MTYDLNWQVPGRLLQLTIDSEYTVSEAREVNNQLLSYLNSSDEALTLIIDASRMERPYNFSAIRATQTFMNTRRFRISMWLPMTILSSYP